MLTDLKRLAKVRYIPLYFLLWLIPSPDRDSQPPPDTVNATLSAARITLILSLTIMEVFINFSNDLYRSTFLCFLELVIRGVLVLLRRYIAVSLKLFPEYLTVTFSLVTRWRK